MTEVTTQAALDKALAKNPNGAITLSAGRFSLSLTGAVEPVLVLLAGAHLSVSATAGAKASVEARENSSVESWENSSVMARENSSVEARGYVFIRLYSAKFVIAGPKCIVAQHGKTKAKGGKTIACPPPATGAEWCDFYGLPVVRGVVTLYKAVNADGKSPHGCDYSPGLKPKAADWDGGKAECGGGLHFSPHPKMALAFHRSAKRFIACPVKVSGIAVHPNGDYLEKVKVEGCCGPTFEVDRNGKPLVSA